MTIAERIASEYKNAGDKKAVIICGPTASGKSSVAMELCGLLDGELVSCDSMQIYRMMDIGTAKPTPEEQRLVRHHMIDIVDPWINYSSFMYKRDAEKEIRNVFARGKTPVICGGTGLYVNSLIDNREYSDEPEETFFSDEFRAEKERCDMLIDQGDRDALHELLTKYDPDAAADIHKNNVKRVYRALFLYFTTGKTRSERNIESLKNKPDINYYTYCLMPERDKLYGKIDQRVDVMRSQGLFEEVGKVYGECRLHVDQKDVDSLAILKLTALNAIGYKELIPLLDFPELKPLKDIDQCSSTDAAFDRIKQDSRQYAKRQITWFKKTPGTIFIEI